MADFILADLIKSDASSHVSSTLRQATFKWPVAGIHPGARAMTGWREAVVVL